MSRSDADPSLQLLTPAEDVADPELSIVIPALDEATTVGEFVDWCWQGLAKANIRGEILIVDSSRDTTGEIALARGVRVLRAPRRGIGQAYIDAIPYIRGRFVLMGDADLTYDFREIGPFVEKFRAGYQFIIGSRLRGSIEPGAMPPLHRYLGIPATSWLLNVIYSSRFSDIHCGMRGCTADALRQMNLTSPSWGYASEMVIKAVRNRLRITEVPVQFLKNRAGRISHLRRGGWGMPWLAAWMNVKAMCINGADFFLFKPGVALLAAGSVLVLLLTGGPITIGSITFSLFWMLTGAFFFVLGLQFFFMGILSRLINDSDGRVAQCWLKVFDYERTAVGAALAFLAGFLLVARFIAAYVRAGFSFQGIPGAAYPAVTGLLAMTSAFITFTFVSLFHALAARRDG